MTDERKIRELEQAVTNYLRSQGLKEFAWASKEERDGWKKGGNIEACLRVDGDASFYVWELEGIEDISRVGKRYGFLAEPLNHIDIGFMNAERFWAMTRSSRP